MRFTPLRVALLGIVLVVAFQWFVVQGYGGNWTMLFCSGVKNPPPPDLSGKIYQFPDSYGFDGQFYLYIARDFANVRDTSAYVDNPSMRWSRALVPGMASALALGDPDRTTYTYILVVWAFCAAGIWICATLCELWGYPAFAGIGFLAIPAVLVSLDRMMTDISLVVVLIAIVLAMEKRNGHFAYLALILAPLARETGLALTAGWIVYHIWKREWKPAFWGAITTLPGIMWILAMRLKFGGDAAFWFGAPFTGIARRMIHPFVYDTPSFGHLVAAITDYIGAIGIAVSFVIAIALLFRGERSYLVFSAVVYTLGIAFFAKEDMWGEAYSYTRTGGPVALILALVGVKERRWWLVAPIVLALPRIALQYASVTLTATRVWLQ